MVELPLQTVSMLDNEEFVEGTLKTWTEKAQDAKEKVDGDENSGLKKVQPTNLTSISSTAHAANDRRGGGSQETAKQSEIAHENQHQNHQLEQTLSKPSTVETGRRSSRSKSQSSESNAKEKSSLEANFCETFDKGINWNRKLRLCLRKVDEDCNFFSSLTCRNFEQKSPYKGPRNVRSSGKIKRVSGPFSPMKRCAFFGRFFSVLNRFFLSGQC